MQRQPGPRAARSDCVCACCPGGVCSERMHTSGGALVAAVRPAAAAGPAGWCVHDSQLCAWDCSRAAAAARHCLQTPVAEGHPRSAMHPRPRCASSQPPAPQPAPLPGPSQRQQAGLLTLMDSALCARAGSSAAAWPAAGRGWPCATRCCARARPCPRPSAPGSWRTRAPATRYSTWCALGSGAYG